MSSSTYLVRFYLRFSLYLYLYTVCNFTTYILYSFVLIALVHLLTSILDTVVALSYQCLCVVHNCMISIRKDTISPCLLLRFSSFYFQRPLLPASRAKLEARSRSRRKLLLALVRRRLEVQYEYEVLHTSQYVVEVHDD